MTPEQSKYFDDMEWLFLQPGWKTFIDDLTANQEALRACVLNVENEKDLFRAQGRNDVFNQVIGFEDTIEQLKTSLKDEPEDYESPI